MHLQTVPVQYPSPSCESQEDCRSDLYTLRKLCRTLPAIPLHLLARILRVSSKRILEFSITLTWIIIITHQQTCPPKISSVVLAIRNSLDNQPKNLEPIQRSLVPHHPSPPLLLGLIDYTVVQLTNSNVMFGLFCYEKYEKTSSVSKEKGTEKFFGNKSIKGTRWRFGCRSHRSVSDWLPPPVLAAATISRKTVPDKEDGHRLGSKGRQLRWQVITDHGNLFVLLRRVQHSQVRDPRQTSLRSPHPFIDRKLVALRSIKSVTAVFCC